MLAELETKDDLPSQFSIRVLEPFLNRYSYIDDLVGWFLE